MSEPQVLTERSGEIATITLSRPEALNAITPQMLGELVAALEQAATDDAVRVVVLTGAGRAFSAGVDLKALGQVDPRDGVVGDALDGPARAATTLLSTMPKPVVAKVNGHCFTGALELALACDLMIVAEAAKLGDTHAKFGLRPTWGMTARLPALVGPVRARELSLTARTFTGREAADFGLAAEALPLEELDARVDELCATLAANSAGSLAAYKELYRKPEVDAALEREYAATFRIPDTAERVGGFTKK